MLLALVKTTGRWVGVLPGLRRLNLRRPPGKMVSQTADTSNGVVLLLKAQLTAFAAGATVLSPMRPFFEEIGLSASNDLR